MAKTVKCQYCSQEINADEVVKYNNKNFHADCCEQYKDRKAIFRYVYLLFGFKNENKPGPLIITQLKKYMSQNPHYTYKGVLNALKYFYEVKKGQKKKANEGIGIVPYVYDEAQEYFRNLSEKQEKIAKVVEQQLKKEPIVIRVEKDKERKEKPLYNLEEL